MALGLEMAKTFQSIILNISDCPQPHRVEWLGPRAARCEVTDPTLIIGLAQHGSQQVESPSFTVPLGAGFTRRGTQARAGFPWDHRRPFEKCGSVHRPESRVLGRTALSDGKTGGGGSGSNQKRQPCLEVSSPWHPAGVQRAGEVPA